MEMQYAIKVRKAARLGWPSITQGGILVAQDAAPIQSGASAFIPTQSKNPTTQRAAHDRSPTLGLPRLGLSLALCARDLGRTKSGGTHADALCVSLFKDPDVMGVHDGLQVRVVLVPQSTLMLDPWMVLQRTLMEGT